jgi:acetyltransferase-like isoleucine patch superfamily enzyme/glycosyltransferase involved in cell wall biosynthesis/SAM-dependent methyltransferase
MKFSFVIPVYNTGHFVEKCVRSITGSDFSDLEIIVIDDGSTDNSRSILEELAGEFATIRIIDQGNKGQGAARNVGITTAKGDYIWFVDSDDWLFDGSLHRVAKAIDKHTPDVVVLNYVMASEDGELTPISNVPVRVIGKVCNPSEDEGVFASVSCWNAPPWRLVCKRTLLTEHEIKFSEGVFYEDHPFAINLMFLAKRVYIDPAASYAYLQRSGSTTKNNDKKSLDFLTIRRTCIDLFKKFGKFEIFHNLSSSYIAPLNFYNAHVAPEFRKKFISGLGRDLPGEELQLLERHGDIALVQFARSAIAGRAAIPSLPTRVARRLLSGQDRRLIIASVKRRIKKRLRRYLFNLLSFMSRAKQAIDTGRPAQKHHRLGIGSRLEHARVDVRIIDENRDYLIVGDHSLIGGQYVFERGIGTISIGNFSSVGHGTMMICTQPGGITIGNQVMVSWDVTIIDSNSHALDPDLRANDAFDWLAGIDAGKLGVFKSWDSVESAPIVIEDRAWIGFGATIMKGVTVGKGAIIAAKSVVTKDVAPYTIVAGNPARFITYVPRSRWNWEDIISAAHGDPSLQDTVKYAYLHKDHADTLDRFRRSEEFEELAQIISEFGAESGSLLDVGAGNGVCSIAFALANHHVVAIEPGEGMVGGIQAIDSMARIGQSIDPSIVDRLAWEKADILSYRTEKRFDSVLCRQALHHFADPYLAVRNIFDLLKPGGVALFVREHVILDDEDKANFLGGHPFQKFYGGENAYKLEQYKDFITQSGLRLERVLTFSDSPINFEPHTREVAESLDEREIAGRPYTFIAVKPRP